MALAALVQRPAQPAAVAPVHLRDRMAVAVRVRQLEQLAPVAPVQPREPRAVARAVLAAAIAPQGRRVPGRALQAAGRGKPRAAQAPVNKGLAAVR